jgi:hypothetical protein
LPENKLDEFFPEDNGDKILNELRKEDERARRQMERSLRSDKSSKNKMKKRERSHSSDKQ